MESLINQALSVVVTDEKCSLCDVLLISDAVKFSHCTSRRHLTNIEAYRKQIKVNLESLQAVQVPKVRISPLLPVPTPPVLPFFKCLMCNRQFEFERMLANHWSINHNRIYPFYCPACHLSINSPEQMFEHFKTERHQTKPEGQYTPFCSNLSTELKNLMLVNGCNVCNKTFPQPILDNALQHYKAAHHQSAVTRWFMDRKKKTESKVSENADFQTSTFCYVCKIKFLKSEKNAHVQSFPHNALTEIKVALVKKGVAEVFWRKYQEGFSCQLCDAKLAGFSQFEGHFNSSNHKHKFQEWLESTSLSKFQPVFREKIKWFYCHICDKDLDGTSDAANHYTGFVHERYASMYCEICAKRFVSVAQLKQHKEFEHYRQSTELVNTLATFSAPEKNIQSSRNSETSESSVQSSLASKIKELCKNPSHPVVVENLLEHSNQEPDDRNKNLKDQVFKQLQKLVQKLYYSKTVPYEYGLDYLKKINKDIEQISQNFKPNSTKGTETGNDVLLKNEAGIALPSKKSFEGAKKNIQMSVIIDKADTLPLTSVVKDCSEKTENYPKDGSMHEGLASPALTNIENNSRKWFPTCFNGSSVLKKPRELGTSDTETVLKPSNLVKTTKDNETISDLLGGILERKEELESEHQNEPEILLEKDVLKEIEILLRTIEQGDAPLDETLWCLERYNKQLEKKDFIKNNDKILFREQYQEGKNSTSIEIENGTSIEIDVEGSNETCDSRSVNQANDVELDSSESTGLSNEVSLKIEKTNGQQIQPSLFNNNYCLLESIGSTSSADLMSDISIEKLSPELIDTSIGTLDMHLSLSIDTSDYVSVKEEADKVSNIGLIESQDTAKNDQINVKYSYTVEELTRLCCFSKLDPQVKSKINKHNLWSKNYIGPPTDFQNGIYNYYSQGNLTLFMNFLDAYLQGPVTEMCEQIQ